MGVSSERDPPVAKVRVWALDIRVLSPELIGLQSTIYEFAPLLSYLTQIID